MQAIYLCGFMGCGKSTIGRKIAEKLGCSFTDMDEYIVETEKMTIPQIFSEKGEDYFRSAETEAVKALGDKGGVIACGGGAMLKDINAEEAAKRGTVVYINTPYDICWERISGDTNRPIVMANTKESLEALYNTRAPIYSAHSGAIVIGCGTPEEIAKRIIETVSV